MHSELVSIIITCYNHGNFLRHAIESGINQSYKNVELLVIDDGSVDDTAIVARKYSQVCYIHQPNSGLSSARNTGVANAHGKYLVFLDADDILMAKAVEKSLECFKDNKDLAFVYGQFQFMDETGELLPDFTSETNLNLTFTDFLIANRIGMHGCVMYRKSIFSSVTKFDESLKACEDYDMYLQLTLEHSALGHSYICAWYRRYPTSMSRNHLLMLESLVEVYRKYNSTITTSPDLIKSYRCGVLLWAKWYVKPKCKASIKAFVKSPSIKEIADCFKALKFYVLLLRLPRIK